MLNEQGLVMRINLENEKKPKYFKSIDMKKLEEIINPHVESEVENNEETNQEKDKGQNKEISLEKDKVLLQGKNGKKQSE